MSEGSDDDIHLTIPCGSYMYLDRDGQVHNDLKLKEKLENHGIKVVKSIEEHIKQGDKE